MAPAEYISQKMDIVNAPSRDRLFDSMKYAHDDDIQIVCEFGIINESSVFKIYGIIIEGMFNEDDSGYSFAFFGRAVYERDNSFQLPPRSAEQYVLGQVYTKSPRHGAILFNGERLTF